MKTGFEWAQKLSFAGKVCKVAIIYMFKELKKNFFFKEKKKERRLETQQIEAKKVQKWKVKYLKNLLDGFSNRLEMAEKKEYVNLKTDQ